MKIAVPLIALAVSLAWHDTATGQVPEASFETRSIQLDTGLHDNPALQEGLVHATTVRVPEARWLRLHFAPLSLPAGTRLRLISARDGAVQHLRSDSLKDYRFRSACFNGDEVHLELFAGPGTADNRVRIIAVDVGQSAPLAAPESLCGADDRTLSQDPRQGRQFPTGCTAWLLNQFTVLTAGHCTANPAQALHLNVPLSSPTGALVFPPPADQYPYDTTTLQRLDNGVGADWAVVTTVRNSNTGLYPGQAQGQWYELTTVPRSTAGQYIRITGYGTVGTPVSPTWNQAQKTHVDQLTRIRSNYLLYITDTTGGNSGSPVLHENSGRVIGIHTHAGCESGGNQGTRIDRSDLLAAIASRLALKTVGKFEAFGQACAGSVGLPLLDNVDYPTIGRSLTLQLQNLRPTQAGLLVFGISSSTWAGGALPLDLTLVGATGCALYTSLEFLVPLDTGPGTRYYTQVIPHDTHLVGAHLYTQYLFLDPGANPGSLTTSNAAEMIFGLD